jgi:hypothetical protein
MSKEPTTPDPVIDEIQEIRHKISAMCDHDPDKLIAYYQKLQEQLNDRLIGAPKKPDQPAA